MQPARPKGEPGPLGPGTRPHPPSLTAGGMTKAAIGEAGDRSRLPPRPAPDDIATASAAGCSDCFLACQAREAPTRSSHALSKTWGGSGKCRSLVCQSGGGPEPTPALAQQPEPSQAPESPRLLRVPSRPPFWARSV